MFVPLDRLYDFLNQFVDSNVLIYRFYPHGSRKLSDISFINSKLTENWFEVHQAIPMLMHDQEPLNFDLYQDPDPDEISKCLQKHLGYIYAILQKNGVLDDMIEFRKHSNLAVFDGNHFADRWLLCHSEKNSSDLSKYESLGAVGIYWWSHAMIARDWYRYAQLDQRLNFSGTMFDKDFNVYNRAWTGSREYRLKFGELIIKNNLLPASQITISEIDNGCHYKNHVFKNPKLRIDEDLSALESNDFNSSASADYSYEDYQKTALDVVLETVFDDTKFHLTEKTLRPIACGKPFILVSTPGCLRYLRDYGFETFGEYIDEEYDNIVDPLDRLQAIIAVMKHVSGLPTHKKNTLYQQLHLIADRNRQWFWSDDFAKNIIDEFIVNYQQSYAVCKSSQKGTKWICQRKQLAHISGDCRRIMCSDTKRKTRKDLVKLFLTLKHLSET